MADIFYLSQVEDLEAAWIHLAGGVYSGRTGFTFSDPGWYKLDFDSDAGNVAGSLIDGTTPLDDADKVYLLSPAAGRTATFNAEAGRDEYIITRDFTGEAANDSATAVTITDGGENLFIFELGIFISGINVTSDGALEISFGNYLHKALIIENAAEAKFKLTDEDFERSLLEFRQAVGLPTDSSPYQVSEDIPSEHSIPLKHGEAFTLEHFDLPDDASQSVVIKSGLRGEIRLNGNVVASSTVDPGAEGIVISADDIRDGNLTYHWENSALTKHGQLDEFTYQLRDSAGVNTEDKTLEIVTVKDLNPPIFDSEPPATVEVLESTDPGHIVADFGATTATPLPDGVKILYTLNQPKHLYMGLHPNHDDLALFAIDEDGVVTYRGTGLNYEDQDNREYELTVTVRNPHTGVDITRELTVTVEDSEDKWIFRHTRNPDEGVIQPDVSGEDEPIYIATVAGNSVFPWKIQATQVGKITYSYRFDVDGEPDGLLEVDGFVINPNNGDITYEGPGLSRDTQTEYDLTIRVTARVTSDKDYGEEYATHDLKVTVAGPNNNAPTATPLKQGSIYEYTNIPLFLYLEDFGFEDADDGGILDSVTITELPDSGALLLHSHWNYVAAGDVIAARDIISGRLFYKPGNRAADHTARFKYTVSDGARDSDVATMEIDVEGYNDAPTLQYDRGIAYTEGEPFVLTPWQLDGHDDGGVLNYIFKQRMVWPEPDAEPGTPPGAEPILEVSDAATHGTDDETWTPLEIGEFFTQQQVNDGHVRLIAEDTGFIQLELSDGLDAKALDGTKRLNRRDLPEDEGFTADSNPIAEIRFEPREVEEIKETDLGGAEEIDNSQDDAPKTITTGLGDTTIKPGMGNDEVDPGLGDDDVDLGAGGGSDTVIYRFGMGQSGNLIAWGGGDSITGFTPGEDRLFIGAVSNGGLGGNPDDGGTDGDGSNGETGGDGGLGGDPNDGGTDNDGGDDRDSFLNGLGAGFTVTLTTEYRGDGDRTDLDNYNVTGLEIHFSEAILLPGGVLGGSILSIEFLFEFEEGDPPMTMTSTSMRWGDVQPDSDPDNPEIQDGQITPGFKSTWLTVEAGPGEDPFEGEAFNEDELSFNANPAGRKALMNILGLGEAEADTSRSVAVGNDEDNVINLADDEALGDQTGNEWVVFGGGGDDTITLGDGTEEVVYRLAVDDANAITAPEGSEATDGRDTITGFTLGTDSLTFVDTEGATVALADVLGAFRQVSLAYNEDNTAYTGIVFEIDGTDETDATGRLEITFAEVKATDALTETPPTESDNGIAFITELFEDSDENALISVVDTLPPELL